MLLKFLLLAALMILLVIGLTKGLTGLAGAKIHRKQKPQLFWAQMIFLIIFQVTLVTLIVIDR